MPYLALIRHGESEWNANGLWTGKTDVPLTPQGLLEARLAGQALAHLDFDSCHCSVLTRAKQTLSLMQEEIGCTNAQVSYHPALDERDYGDFTGLNKWQLKEQYGEEQFLKWRRSWNEPIPNGETLRDVFFRVVPYFEQNVLPDIKDDKNVIISSCGNTLRALVKYLDDIDDDGVSEIEIGNGEISLYSLSAKGELVDKQIIVVREKVR